MASRVIHMAIANEIMKQINVKDVERFRLGTILPDAYMHNIQSATDSHLKYTTADGTKKTYKLAWFREVYGAKMKTDELYMGYYLHLIQDMVYRYFVYSLHNWDPYPKGNIGRLHNDYKLLNGYIIGKYKLNDSLVIPANLDKEPVFDIYPFDVARLSTDFKADFEPYNDGEVFFFTQDMADEFISMATEKCISEIKALADGESTIDELQYAWDKQTPKEGVLQSLKNILQR